MARRSPLSRPAASPPSCWSQQHRLCPRHEQQPGPVGHEVVLAEGEQAEVRFQFPHAALDLGLVTVFRLQFVSGALVVVGDQDPLVVATAVEGGLLADVDGDALDDVAAEAAPVVQAVAELGDLAAVLVQARFPAFVGTGSARRGDGGDEPLRTGRSHRIVPAARTSHRCRTPSRNGPARPRRPGPGAASRSGTSSSRSTAPLSPGWTAAPEAASKHSSGWRASPSCRCGPRPDGVSTG